jgi:hypothetical protein
VVKIGRFRWLGYHFRKQNLDPYRKLNLLEPEGTRRARKTGLRWLESVEEDRKKMGWLEEMET